MRDVRCISVCVAGAVALSLAVTSAQAPQPPQFRAAVDLVHLDVSVLDKNRRPVRGLTAADFIVLEDGKPQGVSTFTAVDYPDVEPPTTPWMRNVDSDIRRNDTLDDRRLFVIVMDDGMAQANLQAAKAGKDAAKKFIERLGPSDLAAVLFTKSNQHAQDYTSDKARLISAVDRFDMGLRKWESRVLRISTIGHRWRFFGGLLRRWSRSHSAARPSSISARESLSIRRRRPHLC